MTGLVIMYQVSDFQPGGKAVWKLAEEPSPSLVMSGILYLTATKVLKIGK